MQKTIHSKSEHYLKKYGIIPEFKAGIHFGDVTAGEIGIIKRDITFSGDVLNTASRIQGMCNQFNVGILISSELINKIKHQFKVEEIGSIELRGKEQNVAISTVRIN